MNSDAVNWILEHWDSESQSTTTIIEFKKEQNNVVFRTETCINCYSRWYFNLRKLSLVLSVAKLAMPQKWL